MAGAKKTDGVERAPDRLNIQGTKPPIFYVALAEKILSDREELHIHALGSCIEAAVGAADRLSANGLATVTKIRTDKGGRSNATAQIIITVKRTAQFGDLYEKQKKDRESRADEHETVKAEQPEKAEKAEQPEKAEKAEKVEKVEKKEAPKKTETEKKTALSDAIDAVRKELTDLTKPGMATEKDDLAVVAQKVTEARFKLYAAETRIYPTVYPPPPAGDGKDVFQASDEAGEGEVTYKELSKYLARNQNLSIRLGKEGFQKLSANFSIENLEDCPMATFMKLWQEAAASRDE